MRFLIRTTPLLAAIMLAAIVLPAPAQEEKDPILAEVKANLKDPSKPFTMLVLVKIKDGGAADFEAAFARNRAGSRKEKGNKAYEMSRSTKAPTEYIVYERWTNFAALQAHMKEPHFTTMIAEIGELLAGPPQVKVFLPAGD
jgi:quinol monooxygenase YgiN